MNRISATRTLLSALVASTAVSAVAWPTIALAQAETAPQPASQNADVGHDDGEILVTARRKEESLQAVPLSVAAVSSEELRAENVQSLTDLSRVAPGLTVTPSSLGTTRPAYQIRGQRANATRITADPAIVVYFAEVGTARSAGSSQSVFDLQSVQVLKGPQGTLFGRNTTGGAILLTPNAPTRDFEGYGQFSAGNFGMRDAEGMLNLPISDSAQLRVAGKYHKMDGWFRNALRPGERSWDEDNTSLRASLRLTPTEDITSDFIGTYFRSDVIGFQPKLIGFNAGTFPVAALAPAVEAEMAASDALGFYEYRELHKARNRDKVLSIQNTTTIELGDDISFFGEARIKNIIAYRDIKNNFSTFADGSGLGIFYTFGSYDGYQFSNELQVQGESGNVDYVFGGFYSTEKGDDFTNAQTFNVLPLNYTDLTGRNDSISTFAHANVKLPSIADGLSVSFGARITKDTRYINSHVRQQRALSATVTDPYVCLASGTPVVIPNLTDRSLCSFKTKATFTEPTWDISLNYQLTPDHLVYLAHRRGYRAGAARSATSPDVRPELVDDIEIGSKNEFDLGDASIRFNVAGYYGWYKDLQRNITLVLNGVTAAQDRNAAKAHVYGLETDLNIDVGRVVTLSASYALTKAVYDDYSNVFNTSAGQVTVDNSSALFSYTPKHMFSASARLNVPMAPENGEASISATYVYQSSFQTTDSNSRNCGPNGIERWCLNQVGLVDGYGLVNLRADWRKPFGAPFDIGAFVTNLTGEKYYAGKYALVNVIGLLSAWPGAPRMYGLELRIPFGG